LTGFILDASVAAKWILPSAQEPFLTQADRILQEYLAGRCDLTVPDLFWSEMGNILWKAARMGRIVAGSCQPALDKLSRLELTTIPSAPLLKRAMDIAIAHNHSFYDCEYVALAVESDVPLLTADERLANALAARFPIRWLGALYL
jgi:predicted nucleic acid-binding protein